MYKRARLLFGLAGVLLLTAGVATSQAQSSCPLVLYGTWTLKFAMGSTQHDATLTMNGCTGEMRVAFYNQETRRREEITQQMTLRQSARGIRISGYYPVYSGTTTRHPSYNADDLEYSVDSYGAVTFRNCDEGGSCSPVEVTSETRAVRISLYNLCPTERAFVAILYKAPDGSWMRRGWWIVAPGTVRETDVATMGTYVYFYAEGDNDLKWTGESQEGSIYRDVISDSFEKTDGATLYGDGLKRVSFFRRTIDTTDGTYTQRFTCPD